MSPSFWSWMTEFSVDHSAVVREEVVVVFTIRSKRYSLDGRYHYIGRLTGWSQL